MPTRTATTTQTGFWLMIALLSLSAAGKAILYDTLDPDCFWHLRVAEQLTRDGVGPLVDEISFASIKTPWTPYSWLAELGMKAIWDVGGYRGAVFAQAILMAAFVLFVALACHECTPGEPMRTMLATAFSMYWSLPYLSFRPVTLALVLIAGCGWLVQRDRMLNESSRAIWIIVPVTAVTANVHFFAFIVPAGAAALLLDASRRWRWLALLALTTAAACATPMLPGVIRSIAHYQFDDPMLSVGFVNEFRPFYAGPTGWVSVCAMLGALGCATWNRRRISRSDWILLIAAIALMMRLGRFAPIYAIVASPILAATLPPMSGRVLARRPVIAALAMLFLVGLVRITTSFPNREISIDRWLNRHGAGTPGYPCGAAEFVERNILPSTRRLLNEFSWGGYLAWRLGDRFQILMDGRTQLYAASFWRAAYLTDRFAVTGLAPNASRADAAVVPLIRSRLKPELIRCGWKVVYRDDRAEVLCPGGSTLAAVSD